MIKIPCETVVRLASLVDRNHDEEIFRTLRFDNGVVVATDRKFCAVERLIEPFSGVYHLALTDDLIQQCHTEAAFSGMLVVSPNPMLQWTTVRTVLGFEISSNIGVYPQQPTQFDGWRQKLVEPCIEPENRNPGALVVSADDLARMAAASPSGVVVFETVIDHNRPTMVRDCNSPDWIGFFHPRRNDGRFYPPAQVPGWLK